MSNKDPKNVFTGQSEVIGIVILLSFTIATVLMILFATGGISGNVASQAADKGMENQFAQMDSQISSTVFSGSDSGSRVVNLQMEDGVVESDPDGSRMKVVFDEEGGPEKTLVNTTLGSIEHREGDKIIAYEGGGVWRSSTDSEGSVMISSPEFHYGGEGAQQTLTIPIINVDSEKSISGDRGSVSVRSTGTEIKHGDDPLDNPLTEGDVKVTVKSDYYQAWGKYFDQRTESVVIDRDSDENSVTVELSAPELNVTKEVTGTGGGFFNTKVDFTDTGEIDSYTGSTYSPSNPEPSTVPSGVGDPPTCDYEKANADVFTTEQKFVSGQNTCLMGNVFVDSGQIAKIQQESYIHKDIHSTSGVKVNQGGKVNGDIFVSEMPKSINGKVGGDIHVDSDDKLKIDSGAVVKGDVFTKGEVRIPDGTVKGDVHTQKGGSNVVKCSGGNIDGTVYVSGGSSGSVGSGCNPSGVSGGPDEPKSPDIPDEPDLIEHSNPGTDLDDSNHPNCDISSSNKIIMDGSGKECVIKAGNMDGDWGAVDKIKVKNGAELILEGEVNLTITGSVLKVKNAKITVKDSLTVNGATNGALFDSQGGKVVTAGGGGPHDATKVWLEFHKFAIKGTSEITGFVYAPTDGSTIDLSDGTATVYGGVAGPDDNPSSASVQIQGNIHVQEDLVGGSGSTGTGTDLEFNPTVSEVHYLHITENTVEVSR
jgi:cytoskeletal protein CcmA (bactofilin family)